MKRRDIQNMMAIIGWLLKVNQKQLKQNINSLGENPTKEEQKQFIEAVFDEFGMEDLYNKLGLSLPELNKDEVSEATISKKSFRWR